MTSDTPPHQSLNSLAEYIAALDTLCGLAKHSLFVFENDFINIGFNTAERFETLHRFLLSNPNNRLHLLAHNARPLSQYCPRLMILLQQFGHNMAIHQTPKHLQHLSEPFAVADEAHTLRRFHFDDSRGILARDDGETARLYKSRFLEMWEASQPSVSTSTFTL